MYGDPQRPRARYTSPISPAPTSDRISNGAILVSAESEIRSAIGEVQILSFLGAQRMEAVACGDAAMKGRRYILIWV
jgi:hypothetical protein